MVSGAAAENSRSAVVLTHADAAVVLAKYSGYFDRYVDEDASLNDCVAFLNKTGIYFGLMEVVNGAEFTQGDFARVMGQMALVFNGDAEYAAGKVKLPNGIASWKDYCTMEDINFSEGFGVVLERFQLLASKQAQ
jgi:hypothetical protein